MKKNVHDSIPDLSKSENGPVFWSTGTGRNISVTFYAFITLVFIHDNQIPAMAVLPATFDHYLTYIVAAPILSSGCHSVCSVFAEPESLMRRFEWYVICS
jgi:hypothetical protein